MVVKEAGQRPGLALALDPEQGLVVMEPAADGAGSWIGCPGVLYEPAEERLWLTYRHRRPRGVEEDRGWRCGIGLSSDGLEFNEVWAVEKHELGTSSMERFCLAKDPVADGYLLYISYVDPADNRWRIDVVEAASPSELDVRKARPVLTAASTGTEGVKDPWVLTVGPATYLFASFASADGLNPADRERAHAEADVYNTGLTTHPTGLATSLDGRSFTWQGEVFGVGTAWDRYQARLSTAVRSGGAYLGLYDGSASADENYEERCGLAISHDLRQWHRLTPEVPWVTTPHATGSLRYFAAAEVGTELYLYYESARPDGSHDLRLIKKEMGQ